MRSLSAAAAAYSLLLLGALVGAQQQQRKESQRQLQFGGAGYAAGAAMVNNGFRAAMTASEIRAHCQAKKNSPHNRRKLQGILVGVIAGATVAGSQIAVNEGRQYVHNHMDDFCVEYEAMAGQDGQGGNLELAGVFPQDAAAMEFMAIEDAQPSQRQELHNGGRHLQAGYAAGAAAVNRGVKAGQTAKQIKQYCKQQKKAAKKQGNQGRRVLYGQAAALGAQIAIGAAVASSEQGAKATRQYVKNHEDEIFCDHFDEAEEVYADGPTPYDADAAAERKRRQDSRI